MSQYPPLWPAEVEARVRAEARNLDPQQVPDRVVMCKKCVVTNQRPRITFDVAGVCSACRYWERKANGIDWKAREKELQALLNKHRRSSGYDVIVPASGGKDSSMVAHRLKHDYGMRPLCVKFAPFIYTDVGRRNWEALAHAGFDCIEARPNGLMHRRLARLSLEYLGDPFDPFVFGQLALPLHTAAQLGVTLVMGAENGSNEYGGDTTDKPQWDYDDWDRVYLKGEGVERLLRLAYPLGIALPKGGLSSSYWLPSRESLDDIEYHHLGYYLPHWPMDNFYRAQEHCGFTPDDQRSEGTYTRFASLDDKLDGLHYFFAFLKFGIGRCTSDSAQQVRAGDITRDEALALVARYDGEMPVKHLDECLDYLGMDQTQLGVVMERFRRTGVTARKVA